MFFILSKILTYLILPASMLALLLLIFLLVRNPKVKRVALSLFVFLFFLFTNPFIADRLIGWWEIPATPIHALEQRYEVAIILSGVTEMDKSYPDRVHLQKGADRIMHTVQLYKEGLINKIVVSGGSGSLLTENVPSEAAQIKRVLLISGVPEQDILLEERSRNTYENALYTRELLEEKSIPGKKLLLVTSAFHMRRSLGCFKNAGLNPTPYSTDFSSTEINYSPANLIVPSDGALSTWTTLIKEWLGYSIYKVMGYL